MRVLVVDDDNDISSFVSDMIKEVEPEARISVFADAFAAFLELPEKKFNLIVTDLKMPTASGDELFRAVRLLPLSARPQNILIFSGFISGDLGTIEGVTINYLDKPSSTSEFKAKISALLGK